MKRNIKQVILGSAIVLMVSLTPWHAFSQDIGEGGSEGTGNPDIPVDGGISLLMAAGVGYGIKKVRDQRKKKTIVLSDKL